MKVVSKENTEAAHYIVELLKRVSIDDVPTLKRGGKLVPKDKKDEGIHIKKANRGKFTASAKRAGQSVQEYAKSILSDPNATSLQKKRANFARNTAKWSHKK